MCRLLPPLTYGANGKPIAVNYSGSNYYYALNLQGDVVAILDNGGNPVVRYTYDAWGRHLSISGSMASTLGQYNPFRYRGYIYDSETGLYYLQSRYYDPVVGRFVNSDEIGVRGVQDKATILCLSAYCENDPVNKADHTGYATVFVARYGLQVELNIGRLTIGAELVWYIVSSLRKGRSWYIPYVYVYGGTGLSSNITDLISKISKNPALMFNPKKLTKGSASISIFAIFGYSGKFASPEDYEGLFSGMSATVWHVKAYTAYCGACFAVGVGVSTSKFDASSGGTWYVLTSKIFSSLSNVYSSVAKKAKTIRGVMISDGSYSEIYYDTVNLLTRTLHSVLFNSLVCQLLKDSSFCCKKHKLCGLRCGRTCFGD